jgi:Holliday junction resolvase RusA-like endonuclease
MKGVAMTYVSTEAKQYKRDVALLVRTKELFTGDVQLAIDIYRPLKSGDLSNRIKVLEDALKGICYIDDKQVKTIFARRFDDKAWPRAEVTITEL